MILTNCNTLEKVICGCTPAFSSYVANSNSVLDVGNLTGGSCTFTAYVIDWYRNGNRELVSGTQGSDPDVTAFHPFTGTASIPVQGGTWVPVIRWVVVGGVKYYSKPTLCKKWCDSLTGLPQITVNSLSCSSSNITGNYQYRISYVSTQDYSLASRIVRWDITEPLKYIAILFEAFTVVDRIEVFFNGQTQRLAAWDVGSDNPGHTYATPPYRKDSSSVSFILELPEWGSGDYLLFVITPSIQVANYNTNWNLYVKCLSSVTDISEYCNLYTQDIRNSWNVNTIQMLWNASACRYELNIPYSLPIPARTGNPLYLYAEMNGLQVSSLFSEATNILILGYTWQYQISLNSPLNEGSACTNCAVINFNRSGTVLTWVFSNVNDYNAYKNRWDTAMSGIFNTGFVNDDTNINFYRYFQTYWRKATSCGDTIIAQSTLTWHISSPTTWDDNTLTWTVDVRNPAINFQCFPTCDTTCSSIQTMFVNQVANTLNTSAALNGDSFVRVQTPLTARISARNLTKTTTAMGGYAHYFPHKRTAPCQFPNQQETASEYRWYIGYWRGIITDENDPANNYVVYNALDPITNAPTSNYAKVKEVVGGIQIFP